MKILNNLEIHSPRIKHIICLIFVLCAFANLNAFSKKLDINIETTKSSEVLFVESDTSLLDLIMQNYNKQIACLEQSWNACYFESFTSYCTKRYDWLLSKKSGKIGEYFLELDRLIPSATTFINLQDGQDIKELRFSDEDAQKIFNLSLEFFKSYFDEGLYNYDNQDSIQLIDRFFTDDGVLTYENKRHESFTPSFSKYFTNKGSLEKFYWTFPFSEDSNSSNCTFDYQKIYNSASDEKDEIIQILSLTDYAYLSYRSYDDGSQNLSIDWKNAFKFDISLKDGKVTEQSLLLNEGCSDMDISILYRYPIYGEMFFNDGILECKTSRTTEFYDFNKMEYGTVNFNEKGDTTYLELKRLKNKDIENEEGFVKFKIRLDCDPSVEFYGMNYYSTVQKQWSEDWDVDSGKKVYYLYEEEFRDPDKDIFLKTRYWPNGEVKSKSKY